MTNHPSRSRAAKIRQTVRDILADSRQYDERTMRIGADGAVWARKSQDKTYYRDSARYLVGYVEDMVTADGARREGY